jgi:midasin
LLLNKAQIWEETAAKHVTLSEFLQPLISISSSWRKMDLDGWKELLLKVHKEVKDQARESWFFLFGIVKEGVSCMAEFINTMDSFVQNSPVGQFQERLKILYMFGIHIKTGISEGEIDRERRFMSRALLHMVFYYNQFICSVEEYVHKEMRPLEKELSDFVALAKWEDRGFYAMKASVEKAQSRLYKIVRKAKDVLGRPCTVCLRSESSRVGIDKNTFNDVDHTGSGTKALAMSVDRLVHKISVQPMATESRIDAGNFRGRIKGLVNKFEKVTRQKGLIFDRLNQSVINFDDLATSACYQAITLKDDRTKGAKSRKKKALSDFLRALEEQGISKLLSCVPLKERDPQHWLLEVMT